MKYPNLARFLAGHFGGYDTAEAAAKVECNGDVDDYLEDFFRPMKGEGLDPEETVQFYGAVAATEKFLAEHQDHEALCAELFTDSGNPRLSMLELEIIKPEPGLKFLCELVWTWN